MRSIDKEMLAAVCRRENWKCGNTQVEVSSDKNIVKVFLHDNLIYKCVGIEESFTLAGWDTNVTRNRLRALGVNLFRKNGKVYASKCKSGAKAIEINKNKWYNF